jgi:hypothetical protein
MVFRLAGACPCKSPALSEMRNARCVDPDRLEAGGREVRRADSTGGGGDSLPVGRGRGTRKWRGALWVGGELESKPASK